MSYPSKEIKVGLDDFFGPFMEKKLRIISLKIADELLLEFRKRLVERIEEEVRRIHLTKIETEDQLKIIIEDKRA